MGSIDLLSNRQNKRDMSPVHILFTANSEIEINIGLFQSMPFVSKSQERACWAQYQRAVAAGKTPAWDCYEWKAASPAWANLPETSTTSKSRSKTPKRKSSKTTQRKRSKSVSKRKPKIHVGPRGGKYFIDKGRKVYIKN